MKVNTKPRHVVSVEVPKRLKMKLQSRARKNGRKVSDELRVILRELLTTKSKAALWGPRAENVGMSSDIPTAVEV